MLSVLSVQKVSVFACACRETGAQVERRINEEFLAKDFPHLKGFGSPLLLSNCGCFGGESLSRREDKENAHLVFVVVVVV